MIEESRAPVSRRRMLAAAALVVAGTAAAPALGLTPRGGRRATALPRSLRHAGLAAWSAQTGSRFRIRGEDGIHVLTLVEVRPLAAEGARPAGASRDGAFAAVFRSAGGPLPAGNRTYPATHATGDLDIFFGPSGDRLVAVFA